MGDSDNPLADAIPAAGGTSGTSGTSSTSGMTQAQKMQMAQLAAQMLMKGFSSPAPSMGGPMTSPQGLATQAPNAGQFISPYAGGR